MAYCVLCCGLVVPCAPARAGTAAGTPPGTDVLIVRGSAFPSRYHVPIGRLVLLRATGGTLHPVPFQIDERDERGRLVLPEGPEPSRDEAPGIFDDNDLLVFSPADLGEQAAVHDAAEIRVDGDGPNTGWVYLRIGAGSGTAFSPGVEYDPDTDTVRTARYLLAFGRHTTTYFTFVGADGMPGRNLLDRVKTRISVRLIGGLFRFHRNEQDITSTVIAWKRGPVRLIRRARLRVRVGFGLPEPEVTADTIFTRNEFQAPATVHIPFDLTYVFGDLTLRSFMDFEGLVGFRFFTQGRAPVPLGCGEPAAGLDGIASDWFGMTGPEGTFVQALRMGPALQHVECRLYVVADGRPDPPERAPGDCPGVGYTLTHWGGIHRGTYWSDTVVHAFGGYTPSAVEEFLHQLDRPPRVTVSLSQIDGDQTSRGGAPGP